ncbi:HTH domain-containing protein [Staphylococcus pseudintermedius]|nr:HTH domain-containing protein [Staphylococcus pseudintermedius]EJD8488728.1 HTH domain-containing protein [Staphylococcus pseudintermedius]
MNQPYRLLSIYTDLIAGKTVNKAKLANEWEVSKRTIQRDIAHIRNFMYERCEWFVIENPIVYDTDNDSYYLNQSIQKTEPHFTFLRLNKIEKQKIFVKFEVNIKVWKSFRQKFVSKICSRGDDFVIVSVYVTEKEALTISFEYLGQVKLLGPEAVKTRLIYEIAHLQSFYQSRTEE